jgi:hypothetical protein
VDKYAREKANIADPYDFYSKYREFLTCKTEFQVLYNLKFDSPPNYHEEGKISVPRKKRKFRMFRVIDCFKEMQSYSYELSIDRTIFKENDHSLNLVLSYNNKLLQHFEH